MVADFYFYFWHNQVASDSLPLQDSFRISAMAILTMQQFLGLLVVSISVVLEGVFYGHMVQNYYCFDGGKPSTKGIS